ncbi:MAG: hypothetical protein GY773_32705 [Actinomycetia bacterium]|nr:hypothetical protein [Actinomycetes bacterium]
MRRSRMMFIAAAVLLILGSAFTIPAVADRGSHAPSGTWERDLFGTGERTTVDYAATVDGKSMKLDLGVSVPASVTYEVEYDDEDKGDEAEVEIKFRHGRGKAKLKVKAKMDDGHPEVKFDFEGDDDDDDDDDDKPRPLPTTVPAADGSIGYHSWDGQLCDGQAFTIDYAVSRDSVKVDNVDGPSSRVKSIKRGARVYFDDVGARITLTMSKKQNRGLKIDARLGRCDQTTATTGNTTTTAEPTTTTSNETTTTAKAKATTTTAKATTTTAKATTTSTTQPVPQPKYLSYNLPIGQVVVKLEDPADSMSRWATTSSGWEYYTDKDNGSTVRVLFRNKATDEQAEFSATLSGGNVSASFKSDSGGTITPAAPSVSTVAPASTKPSG